MTIREVIGTVVRTGIPNLVGLAGASILASLTFLPLLVSMSFGTVPAVVGGMWTTCLLLGVALVGLFRFATTVADRGVAVSVVPALVAAAKRPRVGFELGAVTFFVILGALLAGLVPGMLRAVTVGVGIFLVLIWYLVVALAAPELGAGFSLFPALGAGAARFARSPLAAASFLLLSTGCAIIAGVTVVTVVFFLPGVLGLLAVHVAVTIAAPAERRNGDAGGRAQS
jgi:hypothetical protein